MIVCSKCNVSKDESEFPSNGDGKGGRRKQCKVCMREINRGWRLKNKEHIAAYNKNRIKDEPNKPDAL